MSFQQARRDLATALDELTATAGWTVTLETQPDLFHKLIVVGHTSLIEADTFGSYSALLSVTVWVSEADDNDAADVLYDLISPPGSLLESLPNTAPVAYRIQVPRVHDVGRRDEGPSGFLAADIDVVLLANLGTTEDW
jgi:hypothetical protein